MGTQVITQDRQLPELMQAYKSGNISSMTATEIVALMKARELTSIHLDNLTKRSQAQSMAARYATVGFSALAVIFVLGGSFMYVDSKNAANEAAIAKMENERVFQASVAEQRHAEQLAAMNSKLDEIAKAKVAAPYIQPAAPTAAPAIAPIPGLGGMMGSAMSLTFSFQSMQTNGQQTREDRTYNSQPRE